MTFLTNLQVKQYVAEVVNRRGVRFRVFATGDARYYLFDLLDPYGCSSTIQFPVLKSELHPGIRRALRHGVGYDATAVRGWDIIRGELGI